MLGKMILVKSCRKVPVKRQELGKIHVFLFSIQNLFGESEPVQGSKTHELWPEHTEKAGGERLHFIFFISAFMIGGELSWDNWSDFVPRWTLDCLDGICFAADASRSH